MLQLRKYIDSSYFQRLNICFFFLNVVYFSASSIYFGFLVMYLTSKGYSSLECGLFNTLISVSSLIVQPLAGYITDTFITIKKYLIIAGIGAMAFTFMLPLFVGIPVLAAAAMILMAMFVNPSSFLADTWAVTLREAHPYIDYGKNRAGGSLGFCIMSIIAGFLIAPFGYNVLFGIHVVLFGVFIVIVSMIPSVPCRNAKNAAHLGEEEAKNHNSLSFLQVLKVLSKNKFYLLFLASSICYYIALKAFAANVPYKIMALGQDDSGMGIILAVGSFFEVPVLFVINKCVHRVKLSYLYLFSTACILIRGLLMATADTMAMCYISQAFQAFSYGVYVAVSLEIVSRIVPANIRATSITFLVAMTNGLGAIIGTFVGGVIVDRMGVDIMAWVISISSLLAMLIFVIPTLIGLKKNPDSVI